MPFMFRSVIFCAVALSAFRARSSYWSFGFEKIFTSVETGMFRMGATVFAASSASAITDGTA